MEVPQKIIMKYEGLDSIKCICQMASLHNIFLYIMIHFKGIHPHIRLGQINTVKYCIDLMAVIYKENVPPRC